MNPLEHPTIMLGKWPCYRRNGPVSAIVLGHAIEVPSERYWAQILCHEINHWAQTMFIPDSETGEWCNLLSNKEGAFEVLEDAANWGVRPIGLRNVRVQEISGRAPRPAYYRRVLKKTFWERLKAWL